MAKKGKGAPYCFKVANGGAAALREVLDEFSADITAMLNSYYYEDWPFLAAVLTMTAAGFMSDLNPAQRKLAESLLNAISATHGTIIIPAGGVNPFQKGGPGNGAS
nr:hypothetical protein [uncultured Dysosmobacter sp.]